MHAIIATTLALAAVAAAGPIADPSFGGKCRYLGKGGQGKKGHTTLEATCTDNAGARWATTLNINQCIGNNAGALIYKDGGNFDQTCGPCILDTPDNARDQILLKCNCLPSPNGVPKYTALQLYPTLSDAVAIQVVDGQFVCGSHKGTKVAA